MTTEPETSFITLMRAEMKSAMAELELRLVDRFAGKKEVEDLDKRVGILERVNDERKGFSNGWRYLFAGVPAAILGAAVYVVIYAFH